MDRPGIHDLPKTRVRNKLRSLGLTVETVSPLQRYDFLVGNGIRVALRTAFPSSYRRNVRLRKRVYRYVYRAWNFNFHHRGKITERYCDFFVCVPMGAKRVSLDGAYIIPWEARTGKTFYLPDAERPYAGKYSRYRGAWQRIVDVDHGRHTPDDHIREIA